MKTNINYDEVTPSIQGNRLVWPDGKWIPYARGGATAETDPAQVQAAAEAAAAAAAAEGLTLDASTAAGQTMPTAVLAGNGRVVQGQKVFTEEEMNARLEAVRKEEKDKLYGKITTTETKVEEMERKLREREEAEARVKAEADAAERAAAEAEMSAKELLAQKEQEWNAKLAAVEARQAASDAALQKEREFMELQTYIANRKQQLMDDENLPVLPELINMIGGSTVEEVEASVARLAETTASIVGNVQQQMQQQQPIAPLQAVKQGVYGGTIASAPPVGPMDQAPSYQNLTAEQIAAMPMHEYAKMRPQIMGAVSQQVQQRGVYG